MIAIQV